MIILVQKSCLHNDRKRNQSRTKIPYYVVVCFNRRPPFSHNLPRHRRVCRAGISKTIVSESSAIISSDHAYRSSMELFIPKYPTSQPGGIWRPPVEADDRIVGDLRAALVSLVVIVQA